MSDTSFFSLPGPLDAVPGKGQMRAANFSGFSDLIRHLGGDPERILEKHGIDPRTIRDADHYVDCKSLSGVFEYCSRRFDDSLFGLHLGSRQEPGVFGAVTALCRTAPTFEAALRSFIKFLPVVHSPVSILELVEGRETSELRFSGSFDVQEYDGCQIMYEGGLLITKLLHEFGGRTFRPSYVSLAEIGRLRDIPEIESTFGCRYRANSHGNAIGFQSSALHQRIGNSSSHLFMLLEGYLDRVKEASRKTILERVEDYVRGSLQSGSCSVERCAQKLGLSPRSLHSHLSRSGVRFSKLVENQRIEQAKRYLERYELSLDEVAFALGYAEQSSFGRAFKRSTGTTPQSYRDRTGQRAALSVSKSRSAIQ